MMLGTRDEFLYVQCGQCACLQIDAIPEDLSARYYPSRYYSNSGPSSPRQNPGKTFLRRQRARYGLRGRNLLGRAIARFYRLPALYRWLRSIEIDFDAAILDVGCGTGELLRELARDGFSRLTGVDPFLPQDIKHGAGLQLLKREVYDLEPEFDLIMLHHSFEHLAEPERALRALYRLGAPDAHLLIRIPIVPSFAWRKYGVHWVQLDAPRHFFLHSRESVSILAARAGFRLLRVEFDSTAFQFWGSEQYLQDIPLLDPRSFSRVTGRSLFSREVLADFEARAAVLNQQGDGDQACFLLRKERDRRP
jgi:SAM-dependent methyltransferase